MLISLRRRPVRLALLLGFNLIAASACGAELGPLLARIKAVGREGLGNREASTAYRQLARCGPDALPAILCAFDGAEATVANWLRSAVDTIAERAQKANKPLPAADLEAFVLNKHHDGAARRLAYEWLVRVDDKASARLLPRMVQDPSPELRRDAVALLLKDGKQCLERGDSRGATMTFRKALTGACDRDQVDLLAKELKGLGVAVDLPAHFGFIQKWQLLGPFDNHEGVGFQRLFPPEEGVDLSATVIGKKDARLRWVEHTTTDPYGLVDVNKALGKNMGAVAYAFATVRSPAEQAVQLRAGSNNAIKIFLNGKQIFFREEYHHGMKMDQHVGPGTLKAGRNEILVKICQNEQTEDWAQSWSFQLRVSDTVGGAVPLEPVAERSASRPSPRKGVR